MIHHEEFRYSNEIGNLGQQDTKEKEKDKDKPAYIMRIKTGEKGLSNQSAAPSMNVIFQGEKGKSEAYPLKSANNQRTLFQANQTDEFVIPSKYHVGPIKNLQMSSTAPLDPLFIDNIVVRDVAQGKVSLPMIFSTHPCLIFS